MTVHAAMTVFALIVFNVPVLGVLLRLAAVVDLRKVLQEKGPSADGGDTPSYSRVTGMAGAAIVTALYWAVGNLALYNAFTNPLMVEASIKAFVPLFLIGSALFLPYAFNQIKSAFGVIGMGAAQVNAVADAGGAPPTVVKPALTLMVVNVSTTIGDGEFSKVVAAIEKQVNHHFEPLWGVSAKLTPSRLALNGLKVNVEGVAHAILYVGDAPSDPTAGLSGVYGYHSMTHGQLPYGFVYLDVCAKYKEPWSCTLSHEVMELLVDPNTLMTINGPAPPGALGKTVQYGVEVCDPTQGDHYEIDGVVVSNFVTKSYFGLTAQAQATNYLGLPLALFGVRPGGYLQYEDALGVHQINGDRVEKARIAARAMLKDFRRNARRAAARVAPDAASG